MFQSLLLLVPEGHLEAVQAHSLLHREGKDVPEVTQCVNYSRCCLRSQIILDRLTFQFLCPALAFLRLWDQQTAYLVLHVIRATMLTWPEHMVLRSFGNRLLA